MPQGARCSRAAGACSGGAAPCPAPAAPPGRCRSRSGSTEPRSDPGGAGAAPRPPQRDRAAEGLPSNGKKLWGLVFFLFFFSFFVCVVWFFLDQMVNQQLHQSRVGAAELPGGTRGSPSPDSTQTPAGEKRSVGLGSALPQPRAQSIGPSTPLHPPSAPGSLQHRAQCPTPARGQSRLLEAAFVSPTTRLLIQSYIFPHKTSP